MNSSVLVRKAVAFGASTAVLAGLAAGLVASPAQASTATASGTAAKVAGTSKGKVAVSVTAPTAKNRNYRGSCPVDITFSAKVKVKLKGKTTLAYRWLHGDGSKSKVKTVRVRGNGTKYLTVSEKSTFKGDVKGWNAVQVLGPVKTTSKKGYFSVSCKDGGGSDAGIPTDRNDKVRKHVRVWARAWATPSHYAGACTPGSKIDFVGSIKVNRPALVRYRWVIDGRVADYGKVKVYDSRKVGVGFSPRHSHRGWAVLEILGPDRSSSNRAYYKVWCKDTPAPAPAAKVSAGGLVTATNHNTCKVGAHATVNATGAARVRWVWALNGDSVLKGETTFGSAGSRTVTLPEQVLEGAAKNGGKITLSVFGPRNDDSVTQSYAPCDEVKPTFSVSGASVTATMDDTCKSGTLSGSATINAEGGFKGQATWIYEGVHLAGITVKDGSNTISFQGVKQNSLNKEGTTELKIFNPDGKLLQTVPVSFKAACEPKPQV